MSYTGYLWVNEVGVGRVEVGVVWGRGYVARRRGRVVGRYGSELGSEYYRVVWGYLSQGYELVGVSKGDQILAKKLYGGLFRRRPKSKGNPGNMRKKGVISLLDSLS